jgi:hypothetical protein
MVNVNSLPLVYDYGDERKTRLQFCYIISPLAVVLAQPRRRVSGCLEQPVPLVVYFQHCIYGNCLACDDQGMTCQNTKQVINNACLKI